MWKLPPRPVDCLPTRLFAKAWSSPSAVAAARAAPRRASTWRVIWSAILTVPLICPRIKRISPRPSRLIMSVPAPHVVIDSGPLVALLCRGDRHHAWARVEFGSLRPPVFTCDAVLSEVQFLVRARGGESLAVLELVRRGMLVVDFALGKEVDRLMALQRAYADLPMSLADACLVRMSELHPHAVVMTTDADFQIYRRHRRQSIPLIAPS